MNLITIILWALIGVGADDPAINPIGNTFYCDPMLGNTKTGDGSKAKPWGSLQEVYAAKYFNGQDNTGKIKSGDTVYLLNGNHGAVSFSSYGGTVANTDYITIQALDGQKPQLTSLKIYNAKKWVFRGLSLVAPIAWDKRDDLIHINLSENIVIDNNSTMSADRPTIVAWTPDDWQAKSATFGVYVNMSSKISITGNRAFAVENGITVHGDSILIDRNTIDYFANDGIEFCGSNITISKNKVINHYPDWGNALHHDGMQGWTDGNYKTGANIIINANTVMACDGTYPTIPIPNTGDTNNLQGISIFNGDWDNVVVTNNVVGAAAFHGIAMYGINNLTIQNNTVVKQGINETWIAVFPPQGVVASATGPIPTNNIVRNNLASSYGGLVGPAHLNKGVVFEGNISFKNRIDLKGSTNRAGIDPVSIFNMYFPTIATYDLSLKLGSPAINSGTTATLPKLDIINKKRVNPDIGAYSYP